MPRSVPDPAQRVGREWSAERQLPVVTGLVADLSRGRSDPELVRRGLRYAAQLQDAVKDASVEVNALAVATWIATARDVLGHADEALVELSPVAADRGPRAATPALLLDATMQPTAVDRAVGTASICVVAAVVVAVIASVLVADAALAVVLRVAAVAAWAAWSLTLMVWAVTTSRIRTAVLWWLAAPLSAPWLAWQFGDHRWVSPPRR